MAFIDGPKFSGSREMLLEILDRDGIERLYRAVFSSINCQPQLFMDRPFNEIAASGAKTSQAGLASCILNNMR